MEQQAQHGLTVKQIHQEKVLAMIIAERDEVIENMAAEAMRLQQTIQELQAKLQQENKGE